MLPIIQRQASGRFTAIEFVQQNPRFVSVWTSSGLKTVTFVAVIFCLLSAKIGNETIKTIKKIKYFLIVIFISPVHLYLELILTDVIIHANIKFLSLDNPLNKLSMMENSFMIQIA